MKGMRIYLNVFILCGMVVIPLTVSVTSFFETQSQKLAVEEIQRLQEKLDQIIKHKTTDEAKSQRIVIFERELNGYLQSQVLGAVPDGVTKPYVSLKGEGQLLAEATVDLDMVRDSQQRTFFDPFRYLRGSLLVAATGTFRASEGFGYLEVTSVKVDGFSVPTVVLYELVRYYSQNETQSEGIDLDEPFKLPYKVREVLIKTGRVVVVQ